MQDARGRSTRSSKRFDPVPEPLSSPGHEMQSSQSDPGQYLCIECSETFDTKLELNSHRQSHVTKKQFTCAHCGRGFHHQVFLQMHERSHEDGGSPTTVTKTPTRAISTRSTKAVSPLVPDVVHVIPAPTKPSDRLLNSIVEFRREQKVCQTFTPRECVTRRTQGIAPPVCQRRDAPEKKNRFELRISKFSDTTVHLIDTFGNTLEILSEVFNKYTIGETEQGSSAENPLRPTVDDLTKPLENTAAQTISTADTADLKMSEKKKNVIVGSQEVLEEPSPIPPALAPEPGELVKDSEREEDLSLSRIKPVTSAIISPEKPSDFSDDVGILTAPTSSNSDKDGAPCHEPLLTPPDSEIPKSSTDEEISKPLSIAENDSLLNPSASEMVDPILNFDSGDLVNKQIDCETKPSEEVTMCESEAITGHTADQMDTSSKLDTVDEKQLIDLVTPHEQWKDSGALPNESAGIEIHSSMSNSVAPQSPSDMDTQEKGLHNDSTDTLVTESMSVNNNDLSFLNDAGSVNEMGFLLNMNPACDQLETLCENENTTLNTNLDMSLSEWDSLSKRVNDDLISDQQNDTETCGLGENQQSHKVEEELITALEENEGMTLLENDDQAKLKEHLTLDECLAKSDEQHNESGDSPSINRVEPDRVLHQLDSQTDATSQEQPQSVREGDYDVFNSRPTNSENKKLSSENDSRETNLASPTSNEESEKDGGNSELESSLNERSIENNVDDKTNTESDPKNPIVAQDICEKAAIFEVETQVCSSNPNSLLQMDLDDGEKTTPLVEQDSEEDVKQIVTDQTDIDLSDRNEEDVFHERKIFPINAQLEVGEKIHILNEQSNVLEKETGNVVDHKPVTDIGINEQDELLEIASTVLTPTCKTDVISPLEQDQQEEDMTGHINANESGLEMGSLTNNEPSQKDDINIPSKQSAQTEICDLQVTTEEREPDIGLASHDIQSKINLAGNEKDVSQHDDAENEMDYNSSPHAADTELDSSSEKSQVGMNEKKDQDPSVFMLVQDAVAENVDEEDNSLTEESSSNHIIDEMMTEKCDFFVQELEKDLSFDEQNEQPQAGAPESSSVEEETLSTIGDTDNLPIHKENAYASLSVLDNDHAERTNVFEGSSLNNEMIKVVDEAVPTNFLEYPVLESIATYNIEPEPNRKMESGGDGVLSSQNEVLCDLSSLINDTEESLEDLFSGNEMAELSSKQTCSREDQEKILLHQNSELEQENQNPPVHELDILQSLGADQNANDTNAVSSGNTEITSEEIVDKQVTFDERDLNSDLPFSKNDETELTQDAEKALDPEGQTVNQSSVLDHGGIQEECKENDLDENLSHDQGETTQNSHVSSVDSILNAPGVSCLTKDVEGDFEDPSATLPHSVPCESREEATNDIISAVSAGDRVNTISEVSDATQNSTIDLPEGSQLTNNDSKEDSTEKMSNKSLAVGGQCLKCGRRLRRSRKELVWSSVCFKCRLMAKRQERLAHQEICESTDLVLEPDLPGKEENVSLEFPNSQIKQEAEYLEKETSDEPAKPLDNTSVSVDKQEEPSPMPKKTYKCQKCDQSFRIPALLAGHMKCHTLPQCLTCGCQMRLKYKSRRIPRRCQQCVQEIKEQKKDERSLIDEKSEDEDSLKSDSEALVTSLSDNQSVIPESDLSDSDLTFSSVKSHKNPGTKPKFPQAKVRSVRVRRGAELFHSVLQKKRKKVSSGIQTLYCTCDAGFRRGLKPSQKKCQRCHKLLRGQMITRPVSHEKAEMTTGSQSDLSDSSHDGDHGLINKLKKDITDDKKRQLKGKKQQSSELEIQSMKQELVLEDDVGKSVSESELNSLKSEDGICKKEDNESSSDEQVISDHSMSLPDGEKPRLCLQCGKTFKCNRSLNLHLLSHTAIQCESCGCRLQKKKRAGRWSKKCRICRLHSKRLSIPAGAIQRTLSSDQIPKEKSTTSLQLKVKQTKSVKNRKIQSITKRKDIKWMNRMLAVKGLKRKPRKKDITFFQDPDQGVNDIKKDLEGSSSEQDESSNVSSIIDDKTSIFTNINTLPKHDVPLEDMQKPSSSGLHHPHKKTLSGIHKQSRKCLYKEKNIIKVEEDQFFPYFHNPAASIAPVSIKEEEENQCLECNQSFPNLDLLLSHQQTHLEDQPFTCSECPQSFSKEEYLNIHNNIHTDRPFRCPECNKTFTRRNHLGVHRRVHTGVRPFACPDCPCRFRQKGSLIIHRYTHRNVQLLMLKPYQCSICSKSFKQRERLVVHERLHTGECPFSCKDCDKVFPSKARLYIHRKMHKICNISSSVQINPDCKEELDVQPFQCQDCDKVCSTKASLVLHRKVHKSSSSEQNIIQPQNVEEHPFHCRKCNKIFSTKASLILHIKLHTAHRVTTNHGQGPPFSCKDCDKVCSTKASLVLHRRVHKSLPISEQNLDLKADTVSHAFICKHCNKVCSTKASLVLHRRVHKSLPISEQNLDLKADTVSHAFICKHCNKVCSTKASLVLHRRVHKSLPISEQNLDLKADAGSHAFICKHCDKVCSTKASFVLHSKVHKSLSSSEKVLKMDMVQQSFMCKDCDVVCSTKASFVLHSKVHKSSGSEQNLKADLEKHPFICKDCDKVCSTKASLVLHRKVHKSSGIEPNFSPRDDSGEHPFHCKDCGKIFSSKGKLSVHSKVHTEHEVSSSCDQNPSNNPEVEQPQKKTDIEEKPFSCPTCGLRFTRLKMLVRHKLMHGEDGVFSCLHCGKRFLFQKSLLNHVKICQFRNKGKSLLGQKKVATKRKYLKAKGDSSLGEESVQKKQKINENTKALSDAQKEKKKKLMKAKKLGIMKEKCKTKDIKDKKTKLKEKKLKGEGETDTEGEGKKMSQGKQEKLLEVLVKEKKQKDVSKVSKTVKKVPPKEKQQKNKILGLKKWRMIAGTTVKKQKLQAVISGGKKKVEVKKKGPAKAKSGGKSGQGVKEKN
ncbi:uncharacterized protein LOC142159383 [Mixophyes fleayi]|uniref:uncharacterized protein LOC142159383 n=1 Tax=Mixophyes fleayi TaxID=3061075 RepID=UPI003F4DC80A